jgi:two-component system, OmpR family, response regulator ResD
VEHQGNTSGNFLGHTGKASGKVPEQSLLKGEIMAATVLLVEDDPDTAEIVQLYLQHEGYRVLMATNGADALLQAKEREPDLIILDLMLPRADGLELCRRMREVVGAPLIVLTTRAEEDKRLAGPDLGADDYISKPFSPKKLVSRVKAVLETLAWTATSRR